jgi:hypothetical protein
MEPWLTWRLDDLPPGNLPMMLGAALITGVLYCFLGYRLFRLALALTGFVVAGAVALALVGWLSGGHVLVTGVVAFLGGLCGAAALFFLYRTGVFFLGFLGTLLITYNVLHASPEPWAPWAMIGAALAGGLIALVLERPVMTLATACMGAYVAIFAGALLLLEYGMDEQLAEAGVVFPLSWGMLAGWFVLTAAGAAVQFHLAKGHAPRRV